MGGEGECCFLGFSQAHPVSLEGQSWEKSTHLRGAEVQALNASLSHERLTTDTYLRLKLKRTLTTC